MWRKDLPAAEGAEGAGGPRRVEVRAFLNDCLRGPRPGDGEDRTLDQLPPCRALLDDPPPPEGGGLQPSEESC